MKPLRVEIKVRNNILMKLKESSGLTVNRFCEAVGIPSAEYFGLVSMKLKAGTIGVDGAVAWRSSALKLAVYANTIPELLFPDDVRRLENKINSMSAEVDASQLSGGGAAPKEIEAPDAVVSRGEMARDVEICLSRLTPREEKVLRLRFGFEGDPMTAAEVGEDFEINEARVRQIEAKALRKLRGPGLNSLGRELRRHR